MMGILQPPHRPPFRLCRVPPLSKERGGGNSAQSPGGWRRSVMGRSRTTPHNPPEVFGEGPAWVHGEGVHGAASGAMQGGRFPSLPAAAALEVVEALAAVEAVEVVVGLAADDVADRPRGFALFVVVAVLDLEVVGIPADAAATSVSGGCARHRAARRRRQLDGARGTREPGGAGGGVRCESFVEAKWEGGIGTFYVLGRHRLAQGCRNISPKD